VFLIGVDKKEPNMDYLKEELKKLSAKVITFEEAINMIKSELSKAK